MLYYFQKWTMITLASVAISLTIGLVLMQGVYGYINPYEYNNDPKLMNHITRLNGLEEMVNYCREHADRPNPLQDLEDKGLLEPRYQGQDCKSIKNEFDTLNNEITMEIRNYTSRLY